MKNDIQKVLSLAKDDNPYASRLHEAETKLRVLGYVRGRDGSWRLKVTLADIAMADRLREAETALTQSGFSRDCDGRWRRKPTAEDLVELARIREAAQ